MCGYTGTSQSEHRKLHPSCGWLYNEYTFKPWNRTGSLPTEPGYYYLVNDVELTETWNVPAGRTYLCMSGKNITMKGDGAVISVAKGANLLMTDCKEEENKITHSEGQGSGIAISSKGKAYLCGIKITGNKAEKGGGIYCESADENSFQVSRNTIIDGNTALDGTASNVYLGKDQRIYVWDPGEKMRIGATTEVQPTEEKPVTITKFGKVTDANYVFSDQNYDIGDVEEDNSGWTRRNLILVPRATAVTDTNVDGTTGNRSLGLGTSIMRNPAIPTENDDWSGSYVWFGYDYQYNSQYNPGKPIKYRVLSKNTTELGKNGENTLFLDSDHLMIDERKYDQNTNSGNAVISYMSSYYGYAKEAEKKAFVNSTITETGKEDYPFFILTSEQARSGRYGYSNSDTGAGRIKSSRYGSIYKWWLHGGESYVTTDGTIVQDKDVNAGGGIATNINLSNILLSEVVAGEAGKLNAEYKLTVLAGKADAGEENMKVTLDTTENIQRTEDEVTVSYELSHYVKQGYSETAKYYRINQVAVLFLDKEYTEGNTNQAHLLGYANVDEKEFKDYPPYRYDEGFEGSYTKKFVVPDDLKDKKCGEDYYAYLIAVQENGENETDFASEPVEITIPKATRGVKHTTRDEEKTYDGNTIDVTELFTLDSVLKPYLDSNRVTVTYNLLSGAEDPEVTGEGTLTADHKLTVTKCGIFKIKVTTGVVYDEENDPIYGAGEVTATLTVDKAKGTASVSVPDTVTYGDTYTVTASSDTNTGTNPVFTYAKNLSDGTSEILAGQPKDAGTYTVTAHFAATDLYEACAATETFTIQPRAAVLEWSGTELVYNGKEQSVTATVKNALSGDTFDLKYAGNKETDVSDQYKAVVTELGNPNYTFENADDAVHPWKIQYLDTSADIIYQGTPGEDDWYQNVTLKAPEGYEISFNDGTTWLSTLPYSREGQYILYYCLREKSTGYITAERSTKVLKIDTTAPTGDIQVKDTSIKADSDAGIWNLIKKIFFKEKVEITAVGSDSVSKASKLEYQTVANDASFDKDGTWKAVAASAGSEGSITGSFEVAAKYKGRVFIRVTDQAGNSTILNSEGIVVYADVTEAGTADFVRTSTTDVITSISVNGNTIASVKNGESLLAADAYEVNAAGNVVLKATYLNTLRPGKYELTIRWNPFGESYEADSNGLSQAPNDTVLMLTVQGAAGSIRNILDQSKEYDGTAVSAPTFTTTNTYAADGVKVEYKKRSDAEAAYTTAVPKDAGDYTVRITVAADDTYNEVSETADFTIRQRKITVTASDASKHMEAADPELTYEITSGSLVKGESLNGIRISRAAGEDAASYEITASQEADANLNYEITFVKGTFTIEPHTAVNIAEVPATCTEAGKEAGKEAGTRCSVCDKVLSGLQEIPALGHDWSGAWKESEQGSKLNQREKSCARGCGAMKYEITPKLDELPVNTIAKIEFTKDVYEVPEAFKTDAKLDTTEKIKEQLKGYIALGYSEEHTQIYDVDLLISTDNGVTWTKADENLFPAEGLLVTLPYPEGTNAKGYDFSVVHMFTTSALGKTPGEVERPAVVKGADGLQFRVMGLSPVEVSWKAVPKKGSHSSGSHGKQEPTSVSAAPVNTINAVQSAHTGDNSMPLFWLCMIVLSGAAGIVIWRKRRKNV